MEFYDKLSNFGVFFFSSFGFIYFVLKNVSVISDDNKQKANKKNDNPGGQFDKVCGIYKVMKS